MRALVFVVIAVLGGCGSKSEDPPAEQPARIYAHSRNALYLFEPHNNTLTELGAFQGVTGDVTDIALDKDDVMYAVTFDSLYRVEYNPGPPRATRLAALGTPFNGLTMLPAGSLDEGKEVLVGVTNAGGYYRVDVSGAGATITQLGSYEGHRSSGDIVAASGGQVYATTKVDGSADNSDHVVMVDPKTGKVTKDVGSTRIGDASVGLYGVGYWGGIMYGFGSNGSVYKIDLQTAAATELPVANKPASGFWGAGSSTLAK